MGKIRHYEVTVDSDVFAISLVSEPAIEVDFIALSKEKPLQVLLEKEDRHIIVGCVLVPDKPIYRNYDGDEFYIQFTSDTVSKLAHDYLMSDRIYNFTTQHNDVADNVAVIESWVKESDNDKSVQYGLDVPVGSWMVMAKVDNDEVWSRIKQGELKGFSVESFVSLKEMDFNKQDNMDGQLNLEQIEVNETFWDRIKAIIVEAIGGTKTETEAIEAVDEIAAETVQEQSEVEMSEDTAEEAVEAQTETERIVDEVVSDVVETSETEEEVTENLAEVVEGLRAEIERLQGENEQLRQQNEKLSKQPSTKPLKAEMKKETSTRDVIERIYNGTYFK